jgi:hypothetical protein
VNQALVDQVVQAVLYEGYILYPYRASSKKNRQRFTFGRVYPEPYHLAQQGAEPCAMQTQCLVEGADARIEAIVRFLHPLARDIGEVAVPLDELPNPDRPDFFQEVPELEVDGMHYPAWQEVMERDARLPSTPLAELVTAPQTIFFTFPTSRTMEPIRNAAGKIAGVIVRRQSEVAGRMELSAEKIDDSVFRFTVRVVNTTSMTDALLAEQDAVLMRTFASTHTILRVTQGAFISSLEPADAYAGAVAACKNIGTWPILVGDEAKRDRDCMVSSPIILYDYPKIAPESPGDLFDGGEIDEILTLRIMTMTDSEKNEMRRIDAQARAILERTESLSEEHLMKLHGMMKPTENFGEEFFNPATKAESVMVNGIQLRRGDRVRVRPKKRADAFDMAITGKVAIIESIEQDAENNMHLALVLEDDPGKDLGFLKQPGHRFFYGTDEVEPMEGAS